MKKNIKNKIVVLMSATLFLSTVPFSSANASELPTKVIEESSSLNSSELSLLVNEISSQFANENNLTKEQEIQFEQEFNKLLKDNDGVYRASSGPLKDLTAIITGLVAAGGAIVATTYGLGKYVGQQLEVKYGITPAHYKSYKYVYQAAMYLVAGPIAAQGLDDYFYGI